MFEGRSINAKKALYKAINDNLASNPGINGDDITIVLIEPPLENGVLKGENLPMKWKLDLILLFKPIFQFI